MTSRLRAWQCIGCGKLEASAACIGVCADRPVELVNAAEHDLALAGAREEAAAFIALARKLAGTTPRRGEWERTYRALQDEARRALASRPDADDR